MRSEVIEPCPYVLASDSVNRKVAWMHWSYEHYDDHVEFKDGKPLKCIRIWKQEPIMEE